MNIYLLLLAVVIPTSIAAWIVRLRSTGYWSGWRLVQNAVKNDRRSLAGEGRRSGRHLIQNRAEGKRVGASVHFFSTCLLR